jgi:tetratricopeptide (TPR) repeat protein
MTGPLATLLALSLFASVSSRPDPSRGAFVGLVSTASSPWTDEATKALATQAVALCEAAAALSNEGDFEGARAQLENALAIYEGKLGKRKLKVEYLPARASALRQLVWCNFKAGDAGKALQTYGSLLDLRKIDAENVVLRAEMQSVYQAAFEHAAAQTDRAAMEATWAEVEGLFKSSKDKLFRLQIAHDRAGMYGALGDVERQQAELEGVLKARLSSKDYDGANWSRCSLAFVALENGQPSASLELLTDALADIRKGKGVLAHAAVGKNLVRLAKSVAAGDRPDRDVVSGLWALALQESESMAPSVVPPERLLAAALDAEVARRGAARSTEGALALLKEVKGVPKSVTIDLALHAAKTLSDGGDAEQAREVLETLDIPKSPVEPFLTTRKAVTMAEVAAVTDDLPLFESSCRTTLRCLAVMEHDITSHDALDRLLVAAKSLPGSMAVADVERLKKNTMARGRAGGKGGAAFGGAGGKGGGKPRNRSFNSLGIEEALFAIQVRDGSIAIKNMLSGREESDDIAWSVRRSGLEGLIVQTFGGFIAVNSVNYNSRKGSVIQGSKGGLSLSDLDMFRPVDEELALFVTKTGATFYGSSRKVKWSK